MNPPSNQQPIPVEDDPRLTAYALGELEARELQAFEAEMLAQPEGRELAAETSEFASLIEAAYDGDPEHGLTDSQREQILRFPEITSGSRDEVIAMNTMQLRHAAKPRPWGVLGLSAAAVLAGGVGIAFLVQLLNTGGPGSDEDRVLAAPSTLPLIKVEPARSIQSDRPMLGFTSKYRPGGAGTSIRNILADDATEDLLSSFSLQVDDAVYDLQRREIDAGKLPSPEDIRIEDLVNHFEFAARSGHELPRQPSTDDGVVVGLEVAACPWNENHRLARVTLKGPEAGSEEARPVRLQVEFNPVNVKRYTLLGYNGSPGSGNSGSAEGEIIPPGKTVTALYEIVPTTPQEVVLMKTRARQNSDPGLLATGADGTDLPFFKASNELLSVNVSHGDALEEHSLANSEVSWKDSSDDFRFAAAVAGYGILLSRDHGSKGTGVAQPSLPRHDLDYGLVLELARSGIGEDADGRRKEFIDLVRKAARLDRRSRR